MGAYTAIGCSGWNYGEPYEKGGWVGSFYPDSNTRRLSYYSHFFPTAELDATFYEKFYSKMAPGTFYGMVKATPQNFQFSVKVPETVTHKKRLDVGNGAADAMKEFLTKIDPLKDAGKLGAILIQLPPSFSVAQFKQTESFLDKGAELPMKKSANTRMPSDADSRSTGMWLNLANWTCLPSIGGIISGR